MPATDPAAARLLGDWPVRPASAVGPWGAGTPGGGPCAVPGGLHHFDLLTHPRVSKHRQARLAAGPPPETAPGQRQ